MVDDHQKGEIKEEEQKSELKDRQVSSSSQVAAGVLEIIAAALNPQMMSPQYVVVNREPQYVVVDQQPQYIIVNSRRNNRRQTIYINPVTGQRVIVG